MNYTVRHDPEYQYAYALDENTVRLVLLVERGAHFTEIAVLWNNKYRLSEAQNKTAMIKGGEDNCWSYYYADIELADVRLAYIFLLRDENGDRYFHEDGFGIHIGECSFFQFAYLNSVDVVKTIPWTKKAVFYQIFPDRFRHGGGASTVAPTHQWGDAPTYKSTFGGNLKGITEELHFLAGMGVNAIYLNPFCKSKSNHKYNIESYLDIDPALGTMDDLFDLISEAHRLGIRLIADTVFNHCGYENEKFQDVVKNGKRSKYYDWFIVHGDYPRKEECNYEVFAFDSDMPKWNTSNPAVRDFLIPIALTYLRWGFDGLRLDVADEVSHKMWSELRRAVKIKYPEAIIIGEVWTSNSRYLRGDEFDGVMNYPLQKAFLDFFALRTITAKEAAWRINRVFFTNTLQANEMMLNFLDNHDIPRFLWQCKGDINKLKQALAALYFWVGMPCIYYGTELPITGGEDPDNRRTYDWDKQPRLCRYLSELAEMRMRLPAGYYEAREKDNLLMLIREDKKERAIAYFGNDSCFAAPNGEVLLRSENVLIIKESK